MPVPEDCGFGYCSVALGIVGSLAAEVNDVLLGKRSPLECLV